ncbi:unnamed protein product [Caenorhabditis auriculariae]|uniref:CHK kinase-like domain-containing protein n=1 Tax=Caenorhabditis auriculariae TaxID=2777116 RepID=A0A8S1H816_9PELO|nr:unnamed protein product [Caenorhabditis auriculariae]
MEVTQVIADEIGLTDFEESKPQASINGVTTIDLSSPQGNFRVHLVRDANEENVSLEEGSKLAAFYNARFWHEVAAYEKVNFKCGKFHSAFQIAEDEANHSVFVTSFQAGSTRAELGLGELIKVAEQIAHLHAINPATINKEFTSAVKDNHDNISLYKKNLQKSLLDILGYAVSKELAVYFDQPLEVVSKVKTLIEAEEDVDEEDPRVLCHGRLTAENCKFDERGEVAEIADWENIHLGNPARDLTNLILTSASPSLRRKQFMKVFHHYFYILVDLRPPKYQLPELKTWFRRNHAALVLEGIERLLEILSESDDEELKKKAALRWESALDDAVDFHSGNYLSDGEQTFFSYKD